MSEKGFTLVEILVVTAVVAIMGIVITEIFISSIRGGDKAKVLASIKQNGQASLEIMDKTIRGADLVVCPLTSTPSDTVIIVKNGLYERFRFKSPPSANGFIERDKPTAVSSSTWCSSTDVSVSPELLTDNDPKKGVSVRSGYFKRDKAPGYKDLVTINFILGPAVEAAQAILAQTDEVTFTTTIELR
ncbi:prepilin-type N-terminal cleavage/methylation domain-containing protein [Candidatus Daviesbacteria bacterium]|nr:prepilin-type N-terminal cleavage/methylation domain-containing protein [Candidatus Daviesbacteria bacterium]